MTIEWSTIGVLIALVSSIVTVSTVYLRLFMSNKLNEMKSDMMTLIKAEFQSKEVTEVRFNEVYTRLRELESWRKEDNK